MNILRWFTHKNAIFAASIVLIVYLIIMLTVTNLGQSKLEEAKQKELNLKVDHYAELLGNYFSQAHRNMNILSKDSTINTYFSNKSLGMSMAYGLRSSLFNLNQLIERETQPSQTKTIPIFSRITLLGLNGTVITDSAPTLPLNRAYLDLQSLKKQQEKILINNREEKLSIHLSTTIYFQSKPIALLFAELNNKLIINRVTAQESPENGSRIQLSSKQGNLFILDSLNKAPGSDFTQKESDLIQYFHTQEQINNTPFILEAWFEKTNEQGFFTSKWFVAFLSFLALPIFSGLYYLIRIERKNTVLTTQILNAKKQRKALSIHNEKLEKEVQKRKSSEEKLAYQATHDSLTGLPNRHYGLERLGDAIICSQITNSKILVMYIDLDNFQQMNNTLGHATGDIILQQTSLRLLQLVRKTDTVARLSGDEFILIVHELTDLQEATELAERVLSIFEKPFEIEGHPFHTSTSVGIALYPEHGEDPATLLKSADMALYRVKEAGRNNFSFYEPKMNDEVNRKMTMNRRLRVAIKESTLEMYYQPLVDLQTKKIVGAEALMRWTDAELGFVSPEEFIPLAEKNGLIDHLGSFALSTAAQQAAQWQKIIPLQIAINFSCVQFRNCEALLNEIKHVLLATNLPANKLDVEVTESLIINQGVELLNMLKSLRDMDISLSIDDFGTGYSALSYLQKYSFTKLKIDRVFVMNLATNTADQSLVTAIVAMAKALNLKVVAEGIEETEQMEFLADLKCEYGQGYLFSKPIPAAEFEKLLYTQNETTA